MKHNKTNCKHTNITNARPKTTLKKEFRGYILVQECLDCGSTRTVDSSSETAYGKVSSWV